MCVCFLYHLLPFSLAYGFLSYLLILSFPLRIVLLCFEAGYRKRRRNLDYNLSRFILSCRIFVFYELYVDLVVVDLVLCWPRFIVLLIVFFSQLILIFSLLAKRLAEKSISDMTYLVLWDIKL